MKIEWKVAAWKRSKQATASMVGRSMMQYMPRIVWNVLNETTAAMVTQHEAVSGKSLAD